MKIKAKVSFKQYVRLLFALAYERLMLRFLVVVGLLLLFWIVFYHLDILNLPEPLIYQYITLGLIAIAQSVIIYIVTYKNYYSSNHLREDLDMELAEEKIKITGESFYMEIVWSKLFKLVEKKKWFLIYQNNLSAIIIPKKLLSEREIDGIREILSGVKNVPKELNK